MATRRTPARWLFAVPLVLLGLFGMHGLSDGATPVTSHGMPTSIAYLHTSTISVAPATPAAREVRFAAGTVVAAEASCGMDHASCVSVLRTSHYQGPSAVIAYPTTPLENLPAHIAAAPVRQSRGPPQVCLTRLGISRT